MIAIRKLRKVREDLAQHRRELHVRCLFVESNARAYQELEKAVADVRDLEITALHGKFANLVPELVERTRSSFALTFIDPTGWTGFPLHAIAPLLRQQGEVLINFMFDFVNRFRGDARERTVASFDDLFGGSGWNAAAGDEDAMLDLYQQRLKDTCEFTYATRASILKPTSDRTYFHLVYATRHWKGLQVFRGIEKKLLRLEDQVRSDAKQDARIARKRQQELFRDADAGGVSPRLAERQRNERRSVDALLQLLRARSPRSYEEAIAVMLEIPLVDESKGKSLMMEQRDRRKPFIDGMKPRRRLPHEGCTLRLSDSPRDA